jgi:carboxymethylenebutenolidase
LLSGYTKNTGYEKMAPTLGGMGLVFALIMTNGIALGQKAKANGKKGKQLTEEVCADKSDCCHGTTDEGNTKSADAAFMTVATTADFGKLHEEPRAFTLEHKAGSDIFYNCADGNPGRAYFLNASAPTRNYLIVIQEWWGLNDHIRQEAEKYYHALGGKVHVLAVDLYDGKVAATVDSAQKFIGEALRSKRKETILEGAMNHAGADANIYTIGWCFGGMMSLQTAINGGSRVKGCVMYYGQPEKDESRIAQIQCDVLGVFGTKDRGIPNESVDEFAGKMEKAGKKFELVRYEAVHAFANPSNPGYNKEFGEDAFNKSVAFLKERIK